MAIASVVTTAEIGWPFAIGLPTVTMSGRTPAMNKQNRVRREKGAKEMMAVHTLPQSDYHMLLCTC